MRARISATIAVIFFALLSPFQIPAANAVVADGVGVVTSNLLMYFDLANPSGMSNTTITSGSTTLNDLSGNGYNGTINQVSSQPTFNTGQGKYLNFTTSGGYVDLPDIASPSAWTGLTVSFYANWGSVDNFERIIDFGNGAGSSNILIGRDFNSNAIFLEVYEAGTTGGYCRSGPGNVNTNVSSGNGYISNNTWNHWTVTLGAGTCTWYKDGSQTNQVAYTRMPQAVTLLNNYIGKSNWADPAFEGGIADLAIYKAALNPTQVTQNYNAQTDITPPSVTGNLIESPENQISITTLSLGSGVIYSKLAGLDYSNLTISSSGVVSWLVNPNYEGPGSVTYGNFQYPINVRALDPNGNYVDFVLQVSVTNVIEPATLTAPALSATPYKGIAVTITVTPGGDGTSIPGKVTYLIAGKRIPACYKKTYTGTGNSTCIFDPALRGNQEISVTFTPTNTNFTAATSKKSFFIYKRSTTR